MTRIYLAKPLTDGRRKPRPGAKGQPKVKAAIEDGEPVPKKRRGNLPGSNGGGGATKGQKYAKTLARERAINEALAATNAVLPVKDALKTRKIGIEPKDLMLTAMRAAWEGAQRMADEVYGAQLQQEKLEKDAAVEGLPPDARTEILAKVAVIRELIRAKSQDCAVLVREATELAAKAAPYVHAKLANIEQKMSGDLKIVLQKF